MSSKTLTRMDLGLFLIRLLPGVAMAFHGFGKLFGLFGGPGIPGFTAYLETLDVPLPGVNAVLVGVVELVGGLSLLAGVAQKLTLPPLIGAMLVASFSAHAGQFAALKGGMEYPLSLAFIFAGLWLVGPGALGLGDRVLTRFK